MTTTLGTLAAKAVIVWSNPINVIIGGLEIGMGWALAAFYSAIPVYGVAIILLTLSIRVALFPIMARSTKSMRKMQQLQPYVKQLQEKHKGDRQKLSEEQMALFKANNVSPLSGCLPLLIQMPFLLAMFRVVNGGGQAGSHLGTPGTDFLPEGSNLYKSLRSASIDHPGAASFLGMNLAITPLQAVQQQGVLAAIPYMLMVALIVLSGWYQQKQMQARQTQQQDIPQAMRTMTRIMPVFFGFISLTLPAGVNVYFLTSNVFQICQQYVMFRKSGSEDEVVLPTGFGKKGGKGSQAARRGGDQGGPRARVKPTSGPTKKQETGRSGRSQSGPKKKPPQKVAPRSKVPGGKGPGAQGVSKSNRQK